MALITHGTLLTKSDENAVLLLHLSYMTNLKLQTTCSIRQGLPTAAHKGTHQHFVEQAATQAGSPSSCIALSWAEANVPVLCRRIEKPEPGRIWGMSALQEIDIWQGEEKALNHPAEEDLTLWYPDFKELQYWPSVSLYVGASQSWTGESQHTEPILWGGIPAPAALQFHSLSLSTLKQDCDDRWNGSTMDVGKQEIPQGYFQEQKMKFRLQGRPFWPGYWANKQSLKLLHGKSRLYFPIRSQVKGGIEQGKDAQLSCHSLMTYLTSSIEYLKEFNVIRDVQHPAL